MKSLVLLLLCSVFSVQAGLMPFGCSFGGVCGKPTDKNKSPVTPTQNLNPPPSNPNNNTSYTNNTNPSQSGAQSPRPAPNLPNLDQPPKRFPPPKQN